MISPRALQRPLRRTARRGMASLLPAPACSSSEGALRLAPDLTLAYTRHAPRAGPAALHVLCAHGWVDNAATFSLLAPALAARLRAEVVCLDLAGHGRSGHRPPGAVYSALHYAQDIARAVEELGWAPTEDAAAAAAELSPPPPPLVLCGHSMGAGLMSAVAGSFPERAAALVMLEGLGLVVPRGPEEAPATFRAACAAMREQQLRRAAGGEGGAGAGAYSSVAQAVDQRLATVTRLPGAQTLSRAAAEALVLRALDELPPAPAAAAAAGSADVAPAASPRYTFRHDKRVLAPSLLYVSEPAALAFLRGVRCPTLYVSTRAGWPFPPAALAERFAALGGAASFEHAFLPGSHHAHLDAADAPAVADAVCAFLGRALGLSAPQAQ